MGDTTAFGEWVTLHLFLTSSMLHPESRISFWKIVTYRLDTKGVGLKLWDRRRACSQDYPIALAPLLLEEHKHGHDFLFSFPFESTNAIMTI